MRSNDRDAGFSRRQFIQSTASAVVACGGSCGPSLEHEGERPSKASDIYVCPPCGLPCDKLTFERPGNCPNCGMTLVPGALSPDSPPSVAILLFDGAQLIDFAGPWEVFGTAGFLVHTVADNKGQLTAVFGEKIIPDYTFENSPEADIVLIPGGGVDKIGRTTSSSRREPCRGLSK